MVRRLNSQQKEELRRHNEEFLKQHPNYYKDQQVENEDYEANHAEDIKAAKRG